MANNLRYLENFIVVVIVFSILNPLIMGLFELKGTIFETLLSSIGKLIYIPLIIIFLYQVSITHKIASASYFIILFILISLIAFISSIAHFERMLPSIIQYFLTFQGVILFLLLSQTKLSYRFLSRLVYCMMSIGVFALLVAAVEFYLPPTYVQNLLHGNDLRELALVRGDYRALQSIFSHPEMFAWYMGFCLSISLAIVVVKKQKKFAILAVCFVVGVVFSLRRKSMLAIFLVFIAAIVLSKSKIDNKVAHVILFSSGCGVTVLLLIEQLSFLYENAMLQYFSNSGFYAPRNILMANSIYLANENFPLGTGLGSFGSFMSTVYYSPLYYELGMSGNFGMDPESPIFLTDTYWPMIIAELGWLGFALTVVFWWAILQYCYKLYRKSCDLHLRFFSFLAFLSLLQLVIESLSSPSLSRSPQITIVMLIVGTLVSLSMENSRKNYENFTNS